MTGKQLRALRTQGGISGHLVCREAGIGRSRLCDIEREYVNPNPAEIARIEVAIERLGRAQAQVAALATEVGWPL